MTEKSEMTKLDNNPNPNPISSIISKFQTFFNNQPPPQINDAVSEPVTVVAKDEDKIITPPVMVKVPRGGMQMPSLRLEEQDMDMDMEISSDKNTNPVVLWQVYAVGGFFLLRWFLARWNERKAKKKPSE